MTSIRARVSPAGNVGVCAIALKPAALIQLFVRCVPSAAHFERVVSRLTPTPPSRPFSYKPVQDSSEVATVLGAFIAQPWRLARGQPSANPICDVRTAVWLTPAFYERLCLSSGSCTVNDIMVVLA